MANMSYCRFRNTRKDLDDCLEALRDREELSYEEFSACRRMFKEFIDFCLDEGIIEDDDVHEKLNDFLEGIDVEE